jgi:DNA-binding LacI/PurR family transcriptional regulator
MADLARLAGVHPATVSRALRGDRRITAEKRAQILRLAADLDYRVNPLVSALMTARRTRQTPALRVSLAFVTKVPAERVAKFARDFGAILEGARERAKLKGYHVEECNLATFPFSAQRTTEILRHRGIRGLIIAPLHSVHDTLELAWQAFSVVAVGHSWRPAAVHRVAHDHFQGLQLALQACRAAGRRRIGLVLPRRVSEKVGRRWIAADLLDQ